MPRAAYLERESELRAYLTQKLGDTFRIPRFYRNKPDFGDMDILIAARADWKTLRFEIAKELGIQEHKIVGHVFSSVYRDLQTDFFTVPVEHLEAMYNYMSFNDLGNIFGKIFRRFHLKYGEYGLFYVYRREHDAHYKQELFVCNDMPRILKFLGLDPAPWQQGFTSLEEMFLWAVKSPYFSVVPYLDEPNGKLEKRLETRPTMQHFAEFLQTHKIQNRPEFLDRAAYLPKIAAAFPEADLLGQIAEQQHLEARAVQIATKFNGQIVMRLYPDLHGKTLGEFIKAFKQQHTDFEAYVLETSSDVIEQQIVAFRGAKVTPPLEPR